MIKVTLEEKEATKPKIGYPYYGECVSSQRRTIVLFIEPNKGVCVHSTNPDDKEGEFTDEWAESLFTPITYKLICENVF